MWNFSGKFDWFCSLRPLWSVTFAGSTSVASTFCCSGPAKRTVVNQSSFLSSSSILGVRRLPSDVLSVAASALSRRTGEAKLNTTSLIGLQPACGLTRLHDILAVKAGRTS